MKRLNIEIKAMVNSHTHIRKILKKRNARRVGLDHQIDTYFKVRRGRLKLREGKIENFLIFYERENAREPKKSKIILHKTKAKTNLKDILKKSLGVLRVVDKKREIFFIDNVKFHIDIIKNLGKFVEIEAISKNGKPTEQVLKKQVKKYMELFKIKKGDLIKNSYSDLVQKR